VANEVLLNPGNGEQRRKSRKYTKVREQMLESRWAPYSHLKMKNNSMANRDRETMSHLSPFCKGSKPGALLQINVLRAEFISGRLKSIKIEDFYLDKNQM
jgi:hypothetical protein